MDQPSTDAAAAPAKKPATAFLKASRLRAGLRRHPWVYANSIERIEGSYQDGDAVVVRAPDGKFVAHALVNDRSRMRLRLVSFVRAEQIDEQLLRRRVQEAVRLRHETLGLRARADAYRVVHSEGDGLPGLIVDRYGDVLALSCTALGLHRRLDVVVDALAAELSPACIYELPTAEGMREAEGLPPSRGALRGALPPADPVVTVDGLRLGAPLGEGQKTALFLDQRENVRKAASHAAGRRVLDACCYVGTFAIACARAGAASVEAFDQSDEAIARAQRNAALNDVAGRVSFARASLHNELRRRADAKQQFDLIVLDPPKFAGSKKDVDKARRGYFDANTLALRLLAPGGLLFTFSCSHHIDEPLLEEILREASTRAGVDLRILERLQAGADHPVDVHCPEGRYLKGLLLQRRGAAELAQERDGPTDPTSLDARARGAMASEASPGAPAADEPEAS